MSWTTSLLAELEALKAEAPPSLPRRQRCRDGPTPPPTHPHPTTRISSRRTEALCKPQVEAELLTALEAVETFENGQMPFALGLDEIGGRANWRGP